MNQTPLVGQVFVNDLVVRCHIGDDEEQQDAQEILVNLMAWVDMTRAIATDDLAETFDYRAMQPRLIAFAEASRFRLLESLANGLADLWLTDPHVHRVRVTVAKPHFLRFIAQAGVAVEKDR